MNEAYLLNMHAEGAYQDNIAADGLSDYILHPWTRFPPVMKPIMPLLAALTLARIHIEYIKCVLMLVLSSGFTRCSFPFPGAWVLLCSG